MAAARLQVGTARGEPGAYAYGQFEAFGLPSGGSEQFPVIIAQGRQDGPCLWLTASIHGNEYTGIPVIHKLLTPDLPARLRGSIIAIPTLNPAGLRTGERTAYYLPKQDPNRLFPTPLARTSSAPNTITETRPESAAFLPPLELAYRRLFDSIRATADYLIDLHNYGIGSPPFAFRDPVYYGDERERTKVQKLAQKLTEMLNAFGHTVINEFASAEYLKRNLHRSVSGAALHVAGIPAFTAELGGYLTVDPILVNAAATGIRNVLRWAGMLSDAPEPITGIDVYAPGYPIRRTQHPHAPLSGIVRFGVKAGDMVKVGDPVALLTDIYGRPLGPDDGVIRTAHDGYVMGLLQGAAFYQNDPLLNLAVRDDSPMMLRFPG